MKHKLRIAVLLAAGGFLLLPAWSEPDLLCDDYQRVINQAIRGIKRNIE